MSKIIKFKQNLAEIWQKKSFQKKIEILNNLKQNVSNRGGGDDRSGGGVGVGVGVDVGVSASAGAILLLTVSLV